MVNQWTSKHVCGKGMEKESWKNWKCSFDDHDSWKEISQEGEEEKTPLNQVNRDGVINFFCKKLRIGLNT